MTITRIATAEPNKVWPRCQCGTYWQPSPEVDSLVTVENDYHGFDGTSCMAARAWVDQTTYSGFS